MHDKGFANADMISLAVQVKHGLLREMLHHKQVTQAQFDRLMELQRGR